MAHVGDLLAELLVQHEVTHVFGQPGGQTAALYDGINRRHPAIRHVLVRDERSAGYAADAYARLTGKPGVCDVTVGPGATKLPDGLVEAFNASIPLLALVGELPSDWAPYRDHGVASQGFDQVAFLKSMTKAVWTVPSSQALPALVRAAFRTATSGRPGPVALVLPHDVLDADWEVAEVTDAVDRRYLRAPAHRPRAADDQVAAAAAVLARAERPVIVAGGGLHTSSAYMELATLADTLDAAVVTSFSGKGAFDERSPLAGGVLNPLGSSAASALAGQADTLVWLGSKVGQNTSLNWTLPRADQVTVHLDLDATELGRTFWPTVALNGDLRATLAALLAQLVRSPRPAWRAQITATVETAAAARATEEASTATPIAPPAVMAALDQRRRPEDVVISDASFAAGWVAAYLPSRGVGRRFLFARGLGGLGYAVPAAVGAGTVRPGGRVVTVSGDGGFSFGLGELASQAQHSLPVVNVVLNNGALGWLRMWQQLFFQGLRQSVDLLSGAGPPDFAAVGAALGCVGVRVEQPEQLAAALDAAFQRPGPSVLDVRIDPDATPIHSYRRRLQEGGVYPRPGAVYQLPPWRRSPQPGGGDPPGHSET